MSSITFMERAVDFKISQKELELSQLIAERKVQAVCFEETRMLQRSEIMEAARLMETKAIKIYQEERKLAIADSAQQRKDAYKIFREERKLLQDVVLAKIARDDLYAREIFKKEQELAKLVAMRVFKRGVGYKHYQKECELVTLLAPSKK